MLGKVYLGYNLDMDTLIIVGAKYLVFIVGFIAIAATLFSEKTIRNNILKLAILSFPIAFLLAFIGGHFFFDTRPFVVENTPPLIPHAADNGFPSDHTLYAMVTATIIFVYNRRIGISLTILTILIGVSRVMARVHHPVDIIGSIAIAIVATYVGWLIVRRINRA